MLERVRVLWALLMKSRLNATIAALETERQVIDLAILKLKSLRDTTPTPRPTHAKSE